jgi:hypothetical protein
MEFITAVLIFLGISVWAQCVISGEKDDLSSNQW